MSFEFGFDGEADAFEPASLDAVACALPPSPEIADVEDFLEENEDESNTFDQDFQMFDNKGMGHNQGMAHAYMEKGARNQGEPQKKDCPSEAERVEGGG